MKPSDPFDTKTLAEIFPPERSADFFEALLGDDAEGTFDIVLVQTDATPDQLHFEFQLQQRPGKCLACNLTYGLPQVFSRHPVIDIKGLVQTINALLPGQTCTDWRLGKTREVSAQLHVIPLSIDLEPVQS